MTTKESQGLPSKEGEFITFDLGLSSALVTMGYEIISIDKTERKKVKFIFQDSEGLCKATKEYWNNELKINARTFFENQKMLKNRIYSD